MKSRPYAAAGGVVLDSAGRVLLIVRDVARVDTPSHEVRLPKGHVEPGETDRQAALREVCEETGYCHLDVTADLGTVQTEFQRHDEWVQRTEHYFLMRLPQPERSAPSFDSSNAEEARFEPLWAASLAEAEDLLTFESEKQVIRRARRAVANT